MNQVEAKQLISAHFFNRGFLSVKPENVIIEDAFSSPISLPTLDLMGLLRVMRSFTQRCDKIPAINAVRDYGSRNGFHIGLADAKTFVEQFTPWNS